MEDLLRIEREVFDRATFDLDPSVLDSCRAVVIPARDSDWNVRHSCFPKWARVEISQPALDAATRLSIGPNPSLTKNLRPARNVRLEERPKLSRREFGALETERSQAFLHISGCDHGRDLLIEQRNNLLRCFGRDEHAHHGIAGYVVK